MNTATRVSGAIPEELRAAPPRAVTRKRIAWTSIGINLFILPHTIAGLVVIAIVVGEPILMLTTPPVPAVITDIYTTHGSKGSTSYGMQFEYSIDGRQLADDEGITQAEFGSLRVGDHIAVHAFSAGKLRYAKRDRSAGSYAANRAFLWVLALIWNGVLWALLRGLWLPILRAKRLVRMGVPVVGKLTRKWIVSGKSTTWRVAYEYSVAPTSGLALKAEMSVTRRGYDAAPEGGPVTVLYDPDNPRRSLVYECCDYVAVSTVLHSSPGF